MIMIGCDFHPGLEELCVLDTETGRRREQWLSHAGPCSGAGVYAGLGKAVRVGLEASGYSQWYEEMLEELGIELWVGHPARIRKAAPRKQRPTATMRGCCCNCWRRTVFPAFGSPTR